MADRPTPEPEGFRRGWGAQLYVWRLDRMRRIPEAVGGAPDSLSVPLVPVGLVFCAGGGLRPPIATAEPAALFLGPLRDSGPPVLPPSQPAR
jgi:hypothetical protein